MRRSRSPRRLDFTLRHCECRSCTGLPNEFVVCAAPALETGEHPRWWRSAETAENNSQRLASERWQTRNEEWLQCEGGWRVSRSVRPLFSKSFRWSRPLPPGTRRYRRVVPLGSARVIILWKRRTYLLNRWCCTRKLKGSYG